MLNDWLILNYLHPNWKQVEYWVMPWVNKVTFEHKRSRERRTYFIRSKRYD